MPTPAQTIRVSSLVGLSLAIFILAASTVSAVEKPTKAGLQERNTTKVQAQAGTEGGKLRACQAKEAAVKTRLSRLISLVTNMENKFDSIAQRVKTYYTSKVIPSGKTVANYDALVADIQSKKAAVQAALTNAKNDADGFSCTTGDPKAQLRKYQEDMLTVKRALKDYRTSIKNLIVAVHSVTGSKSPKPSASPEIEGVR